MSSEPQSESQPEEEKTSLDDSSNHADTSARADVDANTSADTPKTTPKTAPNITGASASASAKPPKKKSLKKLYMTFAIIAGVLVLVGVGGITGAYMSDALRPASSPSLTTTSDGNTTVTEEENSIASVAEKVSPSIVSIVTQTQTQSYYGTSSGEAAGTGIIVSKDGYVMTNNHVIEDATNVSIVDSTGESYSDVTIIGRDPLNDVAFLKISSSKEFSPVTLGNSSTIRTGQQVVAIGNALGQYSNTVTSGIISGTGRSVTASSGTGTSTESLTDLIQTDASINSGNSGGPLVNMSGQVIGINTAIAEDANGIGFSIPINSTKGILAGVLESGKIQRAYLGVSYITVTPDVAKQYNLSVSTGAYVYGSGSTNAVVSGGPADKAGIKNGDVITKVNDETVGTQGALSTILGEYRPGDKVTRTYLRDGKEQTASATLTAYSSSSTSEWRKE